MSEKSNEYIVEDFSYSKIASAANVFDDLFYDLFSEGGDYFDEEGLMDWEIHNSAHKSNIIIELWKNIEYICLGKFARFDNLKKIVEDEIKNTFNEDVSHFKEIDFLIIQIENGLNPRSAFNKIRSIIYGIMQEQFQICYNEIIHNPYKENDSNIATWDEMVQYGYRKSN